MKRLLFYMLFFCFPLGLMAEDLQFVTTLSSPVGTFSQLETADPETAAVSPVVNFCNTRTSTGRIELRGANAYLQSLTLKNGTSLEGTVGEYRLSSALNVNNGGTLKAKRIMANTMSLSGASSINSQVNSTLYVSSMGVKGAKTGSLTIPSKVQTNNTGSNDEMEWSNVYSRDYTADGSATGNSYTSYLLKSEKCYPLSGEPTSQSCPSGYTGTQTRTWNYSTCRWNDWEGECICYPPAGEPTTQSCPSGYRGEKTRTWNYDTCRWNEWQDTCTPNYCCRYRLSSFTEVSTEYGLESVYRTHDSLMENESCFDYNKTQGTSFNCNDNLGSNCYDGYDYDCGYETSCDHSLTVYWHYQYCEEEDRRPCNEVSGSEWSQC